MVPPVAAIEVVLQPNNTCNGRLKSVGRTDILTAKKQLVSD